jgi:hypothetical protein
MPVLARSPGPVSTATDDSTFAATGHSGATSEAGGGSSAARAIFNTSPPPPQLSMSPPQIVAVPLPMQGPPAIPPSSQAAVALAQHHLGGAGSSSSGGGHTAAVASGGALSSAPGFSSSSSAYVSSAALTGLAAEAYAALQSLWQHCGADALAQARAALFAASAVAGGAPIPHVMMEDCPVYPRACAPWLGRLLDCLADEAAIAASGPGSSHSAGNVTRRGPVEWLQLGRISERLGLTAHAHTCYLSCHASRLGLISRLAALALDVRTAATDDVRHCVAALVDLFAQVTDDAVGATLQYRTEEIALALVARFGLRQGIFVYFYNVG